MNFNQTIRRATPVANRQGQGESSPPFQSPLSPVRDASVVTEKQSHQTLPPPHVSSSSSSSSSSNNNDNNNNGQSPSVLSPNAEDVSNLSWVDNLTLGETVMLSPNQEVDDGELIVVSPTTNAQATSRYMNHRQQQQQQQNVMTSPSAFVKNKIQDRAPSPAPKWGNVTKDKTAPPVPTTTATSAPPPSSTTTTTTTTTTTATKPSQPPKYEKAPFINPYSDVHAHSLATSPTSINSTNPTASNKGLSSSSSSFSPSNNRFSSGGGTKSNNNNMDETYVESDFTRAIENLDDSLNSYKSFENNNNNNVAEVEPSLDVTPNGRLSRHGSGRISFENIMSGSFQMQGNYSGAGRESYRTSRGGYY
jgi:hypothetical protein